MLILWDKFIVHYGLQEKLLSDQGHKSKDYLIKELC